jgi:hypothetical protein
MRLPTLVVASFRRSCLSDINKVRNFLAEYGHVDLGLEVRLSKDLERLRTILWDQWCRMETAWNDHDPEDGNVGMTTLARLGIVVEATGVAVHEMLRISGIILERQRATYPEPTSPIPEATCGTCQQRGDIPQGAGNVGTVPAEATVGAVIETDDGNGETVAETETRGEAATMLEKAADGANEGQNIERVTGKEVEADVPALARLVRVPAQGSFEELHKVERLDTHNVGKRKGDDFHEVVMPVTDNRFAEQCEYVNLDVHQQNGEIHLVVTREDKGQPVTRPLDCQSEGSVIDTRETWMFRYGKPSAIPTGEGTLFGGLFGEWCNHRSIKHRTRQGIGPLRSKKKAMRPGGRTLAYRWPRDLLRQFWLQRCTQIWQHHQGLVPGLDMKKGADSCNFWLFWIWQPGLTHCVWQQSIKDPERWKPPDRSVADSMSDRLDKNIKAAKTDCEASFVIVRNYAVLNGQLEDFDECFDKFEEFLTK